MGLDSVELVMAFEEEFGVDIPDSAAEKMLTPSDVIDFVLANCGGNFSRHQIADGVKAIVIAQIGLRPEKYGEEKRFIEDFGVD